MYHLTSRTPQDWKFHITELMFDPTAFAKVRKGLLVDLPINE
jgi:hypothetical protein